MKKHHRQHAIELGPNHKRAIGSAFYLLDQALCEFRQVAEGGETRSVLYREHNDLSARQRRLLLVEIERMEAMIGEISKTCGLSPNVTPASRAIWARCSSLWEILEETTVRQLKRYGAPPEDLQGFLDPAIERLAAHLQNLSDIARHDPPQ